MNALDVASSYGLPLRQKGAKHWACCPLHGEKTPSLCFFPDGRWYCFGCHRHGDAADLYAALYGVPLREALRVARGETPVQPRKQTAAQLRRKVETWKDTRWAEACRKKFQAQRIMHGMEAVIPAEKLPEEPLFWQAGSVDAMATDTLDLLESASPAQLLQMAVKDKKT